MTAVLRYAAWGVANKYVSWSVRSCTESLAASSLSFYNDMSASRTMQLINEIGSMPLQVIVLLPAVVKLCTEMMPCSKCTAILSGALQRVRDLCCRIGQHDIAQLPQLQFVTFCWSSACWLSHAASLRLMAFFCCSKFSTIASLLNRNPSGVHTGSCTPA